MGRILLAARSREQQDAHFAQADLRARTDNTETDPSALRAILRNVADDGFAIVDQELEPGLRSIAVPVSDGSKIVAALNIGTQSSRVPIYELRTRYLPVLRRAALDLGTLMAR
jgi:IclR family pca regulon transcriptional regulator